MIHDLVKWFKAEYGEQFGGVRCEEILAGNNQNKMTRCPLMVGGVLQKVNTRIPAVRYRMGDRSRFIVGGCPCRTKLRTMEKIRGRFSGFVQVGEETLKLPDFDEALFPIQGLLNFSVTVSGWGADESLLVEAHTLTDEDSTRELEQALESLFSKRKIVRCYHSPNEVGSLLKRVILDKRGNDGKSV